MPVVSTHPPPLMNRSPVRREPKDPSSRTRTSKSVGTNGAEKKRRACVAKIFSRKSRPSIVSKRFGYECVAM